MHEVGCADADGLDVVAAQHFPKVGIDMGHIELRCGGAGVLLVYICHRHNLHPIAQSGIARHMLRLRNAT
jgi:hypothetical protein